MAKAFTKIFCSILDIHLKKGGGKLEKIQVEAQTPSALEVVA